MAVTATISSVKTLLDLKLRIPEYQRPYKWQPQHVNQLLDDLYRHRDKKRYRLGSIVLHVKEAGDHDIVDGQQRLLTLTLICQLLNVLVGHSHEGCTSQLLNTEFDNEISLSNLRHNAALIDAYLKPLAKAEQQHLLNFMLDRCEMVRVELDDVSEAFQFFDAQNARGKPLQPHDLLKAFHLREMAHENEAVRMDCVMHWEARVEPEEEIHAPSLRTIISERLFRIRRWAQGKSGLGFSGKHIGVFKGVNLRTDTYRHAEALRALDHAVDRYNADPVRAWDRQRMPFPFTADQVLLNGKRFFEYVEHYGQLHAALFNGSHPRLAGLLELLGTYKGCHRTGDQYVQSLFECTLLYYYDRFGERDLERASELCFIWAYRIRLEQYRVVLASIDNAALEPNGLFQVIHRALHPHEVLNFPQGPILKENGNVGESLQQKFRELKYLA